jgi:hypothetical protein
VLSCAALIFLASAASATTLRHLDTRDLTLESHEIVIGQVESVRSYWDAAHTRIFTDVTVRVTRAVKGGAAERIVLTEIGGEVGDARYSVPGVPRFQPGDEALVFVWRDARGRRQVNGFAQGAFEVRRDPRSGVGFVQRATPGFAVRDAKSLAAIPSGHKAPRIPLDDLVTEIERVMHEGGSR